MCMLKHRLMWYCSKVILYFEAGSLHWTQSLPIWPSARPLASGNPCSRHQKSGIIGRLPRLFRIYMLSRDQTLIACRDNTPSTEAPPQTYIFFLWRILALLMALNFQFFCLRFNSAADTGMCRYSWLSCDSSKMQSSQCYQKNIHLYSRWRCSQKITFFSQWNFNNYFQ